MAFSRKDMRHLSHALAIAGIIGAKKLVWQAAAALGVGAESASILEEHNLCLTLWTSWAPSGSHGQVNIGPVSAGIYKCYG
jgi:hypothetical protein